MTDDPITLPPQVVSALPHSWQVWLPVVLLLLQVTRGFHGFANSGGLAGAFKAVIWGTNTDKKAVQSIVQDNNASVLGIVNAALPVKEGTQTEILTKQMAAQQDPIRNP